MVDWLNDFAEAQSQKAKKLTKKASSNRIIVDKSKFAKVANNQIVSYKGASYKVIDSAYSDNKGKGVLLERCADLVGDTMEVAMGTSEDYVIGNEDFGEQEYARVDPEIQDPDPQAVEVAKFEEEATETAEKVEIEDAIDGTAGDTKPNRILQRLVEKYAPEYVVPVETNIVEEINTEEAYDESIGDETVEEVTDGEVDECEDCIVDEFTEEDFEGLFDTDDTVEEVAVEKTVDKVPVEDDETVEYIDEDEFDGEVEDERTEDKEIEVPDTTIEAKRNRIAAKIRRNRR